MWWRLLLLFHFQWCSWSRCCLIKWKSCSPPEWKASARWGGRVAEEWQGWEGGGELEASHGAREDAHEKQYIGGHYNLFWLLFLFFVCEYVGVFMHIDCSGYFSSIFWYWPRYQAILVFSLWILANTKREGLEFWSVVMCVDVW